MTSHCIWFTAAFPVPSLLSWHFPASAFLDIGERWCREQDRKLHSGKYVLTEGISKWLTDSQGRGQYRGFRKRFNAWDTPEFPGQPRPGAQVAPTGLAHLEGRDAGEGDIDNQNSRSALGGPHIAHLQGHGAFHMAGYQHAGHGASGQEQA